MGDPDSPPMYSRFSLSSSQTVPVYTECAHCQERVLHSEPASPVWSRSSSDREYCYETDHMAITLSRSPWGLQYAAFGREAVVAGTIRFTKNCGHVLQITVKLEGIVTNTVSENAMVALPGVTKRVLLSRDVVLFGTAIAAAIQVHRQYPFAIPFPTFVDGQVTPLPPSYTGFHPGTMCEVSYMLQVDITRKGLRRHEMPSFPPMVELPVPLPGPCPQEGVNMIKVSAVWPDGKQPTDSASDLPNIYLMLPARPTFASGDPVPVGLFISCPNAPAIPKLLTPNVGVFLIKRKKLWINGGRQVSVREQLVAKVEEFHLSDFQEGSRYLTMEVQAGTFGSECSWAVNGAAAVEYFVRVIVRPPSYAKHIPVFKHDQPVEMATDQFGTLERELLTMNGLPTPALGLTKLPVHPPLRR